ncbi:Endoplasmic reticulum chaperone BiP [Saguinus oedipus]|uniref:Endoplasmic reticulum chaperone BiP n=1 Tax=Saguinus oedipus TaxID=9490 RepID=A0ABQ9W484_SAGOE|nr:Endoplasmic reticulum chaperone BiP [Saguinus oedipus]
MVLTKMKETTEAYLGKKVTHAVVTILAYFNNVQGQATKDAGTIAGLNVMKTIKEPTAYGLDKREGKKNILVFHLGGGTFYVFLLTTDNEDFDQCVMEHLIKLYKKKTAKMSEKATELCRNSGEEAEKAKQALLSQHQAIIETESFYEGEDFSETLTQAKFE